MGLFNFITDIFKSGKKKPKKKVAQKKKKKSNKKSAIKLQKGTATKNGTSPQKAKKKKKAKKPAPSKSPSMFSFKGKSKKRKKSQKVSAAPIDKESLGFSISLKGEDEQARKRKAIRVAVENLVVHIPRLKKRLEVLDISATGFGFAFDKPKIKKDVKLTVDLFHNKQAIATDVKCKVMRHYNGSVGCLFVDLDRAQDDAVHEIVLIGQKEQQVKKTAQRDRDFKLPD